MPPAAHNDPGEPPSATSLTPVPSGDRIAMAGPQPRVLAEYQPGRGRVRGRGGDEHAAGRASGQQSGPGGHARGDPGPVRAVPVHQDGMDRARARPVAQEPDVGCGDRQDVAQPQPGENSAGRHPAPVPAVEADDGRTRPGRRDGPDVPPGYGAGPVDACCPAGTPRPAVSVEPPRPGPDGTAGRGSEHPDIRGRDSSQAGDRSRAETASQAPAGPVPVQHVMPVLARSPDVTSRGRAGGVDEAPQARRQPRRRQRPAVPALGHGRGGAAGVSAAECPGLPQAGGDNDGVSGRVARVAEMAAGGDPDAAPASFAGRAASGLCAAGPDAGRASAGSADPVSARPATRPVRTAMERILRMTFSAR